jgi:hypothetical protein
LVRVGDREAEVYDAVLAAGRPTGVDLLRRAAWDRWVSAPPCSGWAAVAAPPVVTATVVQMPRRGTQPARTATLALRSGPLPWCPPCHRQAEGLPAVSLWAVQVRAVEPPAAVESIEWLLLTTVAVETIDAAMERVPWYACRWGIEVWHRIVQSGCRLEARQWQWAERLQRCLSLSSVLAWRTFYATRRVRAVPEAPWSVLLEPDCMAGALLCHPSRPKAACGAPDTEPSGQMDRTAGGFVGRRHSDPPGAEVLWRGFQPRGDLTMMYGIMRPAPP